MSKRTNRLRREVQHLNDLLNRAHQKWVIADYSSHMNKHKAELFKKDLDRVTAELQRTLAELDKIKPRVLVQDYREVKQRGYVKVCFQLDGYMLAHVDPTILRNILKHECRGAIEQVLRLRQDKVAERVPNDFSDFP